MSVSLLTAQRGAGIRSLRQLRTTTGTSSGSARRIAQVALLHRAFVTSGGARGRLGVPMTALEVRADGSVARRFEGGELRLTSDGREIVVNSKAFTVHFVGLECVKESKWDQGTSSDEPYVLWFVQSGSVSTDGVRANFEDIDTGSKEIVHKNFVSGPTNTVGVPFVIGAVVIEHDSGDRSEAAEQFNKAIKDGVALSNEVIDQINNYNGSTVLQRLPPPVNMPVVSKVVGKVLGLEDDFVGAGIAEVFLAQAGETIEQLTARIRTPEPQPDKFKDQVTWTHKIDLGTRAEGRYTLYFRVDIKNDVGQTPG